MARTIDNSYVIQFSSDLNLLTQQEGSLLLPSVNVGRINGKSADFDRMDVVEVSTKSGAGQVTPVQDAPFSRRRLTATDYHGAVDLDWSDDIRMLLDPRGDLMNNFKYSLGRKLDRIIIGALEGSATTVDSAGATSTASLANTVDEDYGTANSDLTVAKVQEAKRILMTNNVQDRDLVLVMDPYAYMSLMGETPIRSIDYANSKPLTNGVIESLLGFKIIVHNDLTAITSGFTGVRCLAFAKSGLKCAIAKDISVQTAILPDKSFNDRIYASGSFGAVRMDEGKVVAIEAWRSA